MGPEAIAVAVRRGPCADDRGRGGDARAFRATGGETRTMADPAPASADGEPPGLLACRPDSRDGLGHGCVVSLDRPLVRGKDPRDKQPGTARHDLSARAARLVR